jgi:hypothetical protein
VLYRAARDCKAAKYFSHEAGAPSAIGHWLVQALGELSVGQNKETCLHPMELRLLLHTEVEINLSFT